MQAAPGEQFVPIEEDLIFVRRTVLNPQRPTLLFIHGLGESGLCFTEAFEQPALQGYNLVAPDNVGYGRSSSAANGDYSFETQIHRLKALLCALELKDVTLVGH